ncbi:MAG: nucleotidyltransferase domain-containing protein [Nanoarchaeota archaeon]|nr:nucleotidyltransferase domain-containing protein [Nanoarchaeota archaeon]
MDKIIEYLVKDPEREFHIREMAKLLKKSPTTISKEVKKYEKRSILKYEKKLNHLLFKVNTENPEFKKLKTDYNLSLINKSGIVDFLNKEFNYPSVIVLFGSFAKAENNKNSDIDIMIITPNKKERDLSEFERKIGHKIQLHLYSNKEINIMKEKNKELLNNLINGLILSGYWEIFK